MKLLTTEIEAALLQASSSGERPTTETPILVKFFTPNAQATRFITEATKRDDGELVLFGWCDLGDRQCAELGSVLLSELESLRGPFDLAVERDLHLPPTMLSDVLVQYGKHFERM